MGVGRRGGGGGELGQLRRQHGNGDEDDSNRTTQHNLERLREEEEEEPQKKTVFAVSSFLAAFSFLLPSPENEPPSLSLPLLIPAHPRPQKPGAQPFSKSARAGP